MDQAGSTDAATLLRTTLVGKLSFPSLWGSANGSEAPAQKHDEQRQEAPETGTVLEESRQKNSSSFCVEQSQEDSAQDENREPADQPRDGVVEEPTEEAAMNLECDFDTSPTPLYISLLKKEWSAAIVRTRAAPDEAKTWVSRAEPNGSLRWRLLPIHAAIIFRAPENVIEALLDAYPSAAREKDDQGMLPLHLAFRNEASESNVSMLLQAFPGSVDVKDCKGRTPTDIASSINSASRDIYLQLLTGMSSISSSSTGDEEYTADVIAKQSNAASAAQAKSEAELIKVTSSHQKELGDVQNDARSKASEMQIVVERLKEELAKAECRTEVLSNHVKDLEDALSCKSTERQRLEEKANALSAKLKDFETNTSEISLQVEKDRLETEKRKLEASLSQSKFNLADANKHIEELRKDFDNRLQTWVRRCMKLEEEQKTIKEEYQAELKAENEQLIKEKAELETNFQEYKREQVEVVAQQINELEKNYEERIEDWKHKVEEAKAMKSQDAEIEEWKAKAAEWKSKAAELESWKARSMQDTKLVDSKSADDSAVLRRKVFDVESERNSLESALQVAEQKLLTADREAASLKSQLEREIKRKEDSELRYEERINSLTEENSRLVSELEGLAGENSSYSDDHVDIANRNKELRVRVMTLEAEVSSKAQIESALKNECSDLWDENNALQNSLNAAKDERDAHYVQVEEFRIKINRMSKEFTSSEAALDEKLKQLTKRNSSLKNKIQDLTEENEALQVVAAEWEAKANTANDQLEELLNNETKHKDLRVRLITLEAEAQSRAHSETQMRKECAALREGKVTLQVQMEANERKEAALQQQLEDMESGLKKQVTELQDGKDSLEAALKITKAKHEGACERAAAIEKNMRTEKKKLEEEKEALRQDLAIAEAKHEAANRYVDEIENDLTSEMRRVRDEKDTLKNLLENAEMKISGLREEILDLECSHSAEIDELHGERARLQNEMEQQARKINSLERQYASIEATFDHATQSRTELQNQFDEMESTLTDDIATLRNEKLDLVSSLEKSQRDLEVVERQKGSIEEALELAESCQDKLRRQMDDIEAFLTAEIGAAREEIDVLTTKLEQANRSYSQITKDKDSLEDALEVAEYNLEQTKHELDALTSTSSNQVNDLRHKIAELEGVVEKQEQETKAIQKESEAIEDELKSESARLYEKNQSLQDALQAAEAAHKEAKTNFAENVKSFEAQCHQMESEKEELEASLDAANTKINDLTTQFESAKIALEGKIDALDKQKENLETKYEQLKYDHTATLEDIEELKEAYDEIESEYIGASSRVAQLTTDLGAAKEETRATREEFASVTAKNDNHQKQQASKIESLERDLATMEDNLTGLEEVCRILEAEKARLCDDMERREEMFAREMSTAEKQNEASLEEIEKLKSDHDNRHREFTAKIADLLETIKEKGLNERSLKEENEKIQEELVQLHSDLETRDVDLDLAIKRLEDEEVEFSSVIEHLREENNSLQDALHLAEMKQMDAMDHLDRLESNLKADNEALFSENETLKEAIMDAEQKHRDASQQIEEIETTLKVKIASLADDKGYLQEQLSEANLKYETLQRSIENLQQEAQVQKEDLLSKQRKLQERLEAAILNNKSSEKEMDEMEEKLVDDLESLQRDNQELQDSLLKAEKELTEVRKEILKTVEEKDNQIAELEKEKASITSELEDCEAKYQDTLDTLENIESSLGAEIADLKEQKASLEETLKMTEDSFQEDTEMFNSIIDELKAENDSLTEQIDFLQVSVMNANVELENLQKEAEENETELRNELIALHEEQEETVHRLKLTEERHKEAVNKHAETERALKSENEGLKQDKLSLYEKLEVSAVTQDATASASEEIKDLYENQLKDLRVKIVKYKLDLKTKKEMVASLKAENNTLEQAKKSLQVELELAQVKQEADGSEFESIKKMCEAQLQESRVKIFKLEEEAKSKKKVEENLKTENARLRDEVDTTEKKLEALQAKFSEISKEFTRLQLQHIDVAARDSDHNNQLSDFEMSLRARIASLEAERESLLAELDATRKDAETRATNIERKYETILQEKASKQEGHTVESLQSELESLHANYNEACQQLEEMKISHEKLRKWSFTVMKNSKENSSMKAEWASAQARAALAEAQLKSLNERGRSSQPPCPIPASRFNARSKSWKTPCKASTKVYSVWRRLSMRWRTNNKTSWRKPVTMRPI